MTAGTPVPAAGRYIGQAIARKEDRRLLTGHGQYVDDVVRPGMLHGAFLRSDAARARITRIDTEAARRLPGVVVELVVVRLVGGQTSGHARSVVG